MELTQRPSGTLSATTPLADCEDFSVGQRVTTRAFRHGDPWGRGDHDEPAPFGSRLALILPLVDRSGVLPDSFLQVRATQWWEVVPTPPGTALEATFTVTRCRRTPGQPAAR